MNSKVRCGVIGCGVIAPAHIESYLRLDNVEITWLCDLNREKAEKLKEKYKLGAQVTCDAHDIFMAEDVDCVSICTDHASHAPLAVAAFDTGKHVLCEKALAADRAGLDAMTTAHAYRPELVFSGIFQHRFDSNARALKSLVDENALGTILTGTAHARCLRTNAYYEADAWRGTWAHEGGSVLINQAIHYLDLLQWVMGGVASLSAAHANLTHNGVIETEDTAVAVLRFRCGAIGTIEATSSSHLNWENTIAIHGSDGSVEMRDGKILKFKFSDEEKAKRYAGRFAENDDHKEIDAGRQYYGPSHPRQIEDFIAAVREKRAPFVTGESARETVDLVLGIYESHRTGRWVTMPAPLPTPQVGGCCACKGCRQ